MPKALINYCSHSRNIVNKQETEQQGTMEASTQHRENTKDCHCKQEPISFPQVSKHASTRNRKMEGVLTQEGSGGIYNLQTPVAITNHIMFREGCLITHECAIDGKKDVSLCRSGDPLLPQAWIRQKGPSIVSISIYTAISSRLRYSCIIR
jgi:hypothetical protein